MQFMALLSVGPLFFNLVSYMPKICPGQTFKNNNINKDFKAKVII
jgi:hypothetical protein